MGEIPNGLPYGKLYFHDQVVFIFQLRRNDLIASLLLYVTIKTASQEKAAKAGKAHVPESVIVTT